MLRTRWFFVSLLRAAALPLVLCVPAAAIETAGTLFVDLDASTLTPGRLNPGAIWSNPGAYVDFEAAGNPRVGKIATTPAVFFDGADDAFFGVGMESAPEGVVGLDPTRSIEVWAFNPTIASEETLVSWGHRGGPNGTNMAFNYGNHGMFGAVGHWGGDQPDVGWIDNGPTWTAGAPERNQWHHLVYTHDGEITRVYSDGELWNEEDMIQWGGLDTHPDPAIAIASQWEPDGVTLTPGLKGSLAIGRVRIHDEVLTDAQIRANYNEEKNQFVNPPPPEPPKPEPIPTGPIHRYSFNNAAAADATGATIVDSVGRANGIVKGDGSSFTGSELRLDGGGSDFAAYVDLPNGVISRLTDATVEGWVTVEGTQSWARLFDFGSTAGGELDEPGGGGEGQDYFMLSASRGTNISQQRLELRNLDPDFGGSEEGPVSGTQQILDTDIPTDLDEKYHFAVVYDSDGAFGSPELREYRNGELVGSQAVTIALGNINDVNNWLGRSNWTNDANLQGSYDEFRIYDYALTENQVLGNFEKGPNVVNVQALACDFDGDGDCDGADVDAVAAAIRSSNTAADLDNSGSVNEDDLNFYVREIRKTWIGDANLDGEFNTGDLVQVFQLGKFETGSAAGWESGDWNGDALFGTGDLVVAFQDGGFERGPRAATAAVPEPAASVLLAIAALAAALTRRRRAPSG